MPSISTPHAYTIEVLPSLSTLFLGLFRPLKPFVMVNFLKYKPQATRKYSHLSGRDAYKEYAKSIEIAQAPLGSKLLWAGDVDKSHLNANMPEFDSIALLQYSSPINFAKFVIQKKSNTGARLAALEGQWLFPSTTKDYNPLTASANNHVLVQAISQSVQSQSIQSALDDTLGKLVWHGQCDRQVLGTVTPAIKSFRVMAFPDEAHLEQFEIASQALSEKNNNSLFLTYRATSDNQILSTLR